MVAERQDHSPFEAQAQAGVAVPRQRWGENGGTGLAVRVGGGKLRT